MLVFLSVFGIPFFLGGLTTAGMALSHLFGMNGGWDIGLGIFLLAFSVPFLAVGIGLVFGTWLYAANEHKLVRYALSNKRAYIAKSIFKHTLESYTIGPEDAVSLEQGKTDSVRFKTYHSTDSDGDKHSKSVGFDGITNGAEVYALIRQIQTRARDAT